MTCLEKFKLDYPNSHVYSNEGIIHTLCPSYFRYLPDPAYCSSNRFGCGRCWHREYIENKETDEKMINVHAKPFEEKVDIPEPAIKDSGDRTEFSSGAVRDMHEGKGRFDLVPLDVVGEFMVKHLGPHTPPKWDVITSINHFLKTNDTDDLYHAMRTFVGIHETWDYTTMFLEGAKHFEEGAKKYGEANWQKGIPAWCYIDSAVRHYFKWLRGDKNEHHDRAFIWNLMCCIWEVDYGEDYRKNIKEGAK